MTQKQKQSSASAGRGPNALELLAQDHEKVSGLFDEYEMLETDEGADEEKMELVQQICTELTIHSQIEEEIFYRAAIEAVGEVDIMQEAAVEHAKIKDQIEQLLPMAPEDDYYDAEVSVLREMVEHHVEEEETQMFPQLKKTSLDMADLGQKLVERKQQLEMDMGMVGAALRGDRSAGKQVPRRPM